MVKTKPISVDVEIRMKEPKTISKVEEDMMQDMAKDSIYKMDKLFPEAREIDLLNAYLKVFTEMTKEDTDER